jgi:hypothetical protein
MVCTEQMEGHHNCVFQPDQNPFAPGELICRDQNIVWANLFFDYFCSNPKSFATLVKNNRKINLPRRYYGLGKFIHPEQMGFDPAGKQSYGGLPMSNNRKKRFEIKYFLFC